MKIIKAIIKLSIFLFFYSISIFAVLDSLAVSYSLDTFLSGPDVIKLIKIIIAIYVIFIGSSRITYRIVEELRK